MIIRYQCSMHASDADGLARRRTEESGKTSVLRQRFAGNDAISDRNTEESLVIFGSTVRELLIVLP